VIVTRDRAIPLLANLTVVGVTSTLRGLPTEVTLGSEHGLHHESVVNCDNLATLPKAAFAARRGGLDPAAVARLNAALRIALDL
jgi:mRNA interferase MazF